MKLSNDGAELFVPDGLEPGAALARSTAMGVSAHQDDLEIMGYHGIMRCFGRREEHFLGVVMTNGSGSPRAGLYADYTDAAMCAVRRAEQKKAAVVGEYGALAMLDYPSSVLKDAARPAPAADLKALLAAARPEVIYTHNPADKHDTHVAVTLRLLQALRELAHVWRPERVYGCEVWRDLDWLCDTDKTVLPVDDHENLAAALLGVFDSQIVGGKRYDLATMGRRRAHATYHASHDTDTVQGLTFAMDLTPLVTDPDPDPAAYTAAYIERFAADVATRIAKLQAP